jgi:hypothetical protein
MVRTLMKYMRRGLILLSEKDIRRVGQVPVACPTLFTSLLAVQSARFFALMPSMLGASFR